MTDLKLSPAPPIENKNEQMPVTVDYVTYATTCVNYTFDRWGTKTGRIYFKAGSPELAEIDAAYELYTRTHGVPPYSLTRYEGLIPPTLDNSAAFTGMTTTAMGADALMREQLGDIK
jgi:hypothetical protein